MSSSTVLYVFLIGLCVVSVQGLTLRLKGKRIIPENGEVVITDFPIGGCRRYDTLECLSDVEYRGTMEKAYWEFTDLAQIEIDHKVDAINCKDNNTCESPYIGWQSSTGMYRKGKRYYGVVKLGRKFENATLGLFTCHFEGDSDSPISVNIVGSIITPAPTSPPPPDPDTIIPSVTPIPSPDPSPTTFFGPN